jgi:putative spermidine/putrescine transport system permease protein
MMISLGFTSIDKALVEAAQTMGAPDEHVFHSVVLPIVMPFIISGAFFVMIFSLNEYMVAYMVGGFSVQTLPVKIFTNMRTGFSPAMCVAAVVFLGIGIAAFLAIARFGNLPKLLGAKD